MPFIPTDTIRAHFSKAMSDMYKREVPLYGTLLEIVAEINTKVLREKPELQALYGNLERINEERHGAIRVGTPQEMRGIARLFGVMGMQAVSYYNLTVAGLPIHSTAFRPVSQASLDSNPFRIFTSLLRTDLLNEDIRPRVEEVLSRRQIFSSGVLELIEKNERNGGLNEADSERFIEEALKTFKWHDTALISEGFYTELLQINGLVADIVGFQGPHINHLTPRTLDIDLLHQTMKERGINMIPQIQGPPKRQFDILLRQTSFQALEEVTKFPDGKGGFVEGKHRARFGEIEQRGMALTPKGRKLYDELLQKVLAQTTEKSDNYREILEREFQAFPDDLETLRNEGLAFFNAKGQPVTYEDFLPVSAAGIFKSNLDQKSGLLESSETKGERAVLAAAIGRDPLDEFKLYTNAGKSVSRKI